MKLFNFDIHLGKWRVLVQTRDINDKAITGRKIADRVIDWFHILANAIRNEHIADEAVDTRTLADDAVTTPKIKDGAVTPNKVSTNFVDSLVKPLIDALTQKHNKDIEQLHAKDADLQNQIDSFNEHGMSVSNNFGSDPHIGISQESLTEAWNNVYHLLEEALGRTLLGFTWNVAPTYIYGEWPTTVHITALPTNTEDKFEYIKLSVDGETVDEVTDQVSTYAFDIDLQDTVNIRMDAQVLGRPYYRAVAVNHYDSFWLGAGAVYSDIMDEAHNINFSEGTRLAKDVTVADGEHIIIIIGDAWVPAFIRADMNGAEIEFDETTVAIDGKNYKVLTSKGVFEAGTYNIDING